MKRVTLLIFIFSLILPLKSFSQNLKVGYIDVFKVFREYKKTKDYDKILEDKKKAKEKELEKKRNEIKKMQDRLDLLKEEEQKKERERISKAAQDYREQERQVILDLKKERDEKMEEIVKDIEKVVKEYAIKNNFDLILNKGAIVYGKEGIDLTETILKLINQRYKK